MCLRDDDSMRWEGRIDADLKRERTRSGEETSSAVICQGLIRRVNWGRMLDSVVGRTRLESSELGRTSRGGWVVRGRRDAGTLQQPAACTVHSTQHRAPSTEEKS